MISAERQLLSNFLSSQQGEFPLMSHLFQHERADRIFSRLSVLQFVQSSLQRGMTEVIFRNLRESGCLLSAHLTSAYVLS